MPSHEALKSLSAESLWEFLKWLAFGQGRYVGVRIEPHATSADSSNRFQQLAGSIALAPKQPDDAALGVAFPAVDHLGEDAATVAAIAEYIAARQAALYRGAADFEPRHAVEIQEDALRRIVERIARPVSREQGVALDGPA
jgi:hypothetical protein